MTNYDNSFLLFLSRQAPMILKKIFSGFLPAGHKKKSFYSSDSWAYLRPHYGDLCRRGDGEESGCCEPDEWAI